MNNEVKSKKKPTGDKARLKRAIVRLREELAVTQLVIDSKNEQITRLSRALASCGCFSKTG